MTNGYTLIELLVVVLIISALSAIAIPHYFNAAESARMVELKVLWGQQKRWASGKELTEQQLADANEKLQKYGLNYFTGQIICRDADSSLPCFEAVFTRKAHAQTQYQITTVNNFQSLACIPTNWLGTRFCKSRSSTTPFLINGQEAYLIR